DEKEVTVRPQRLTGVSPNWPRAAPPLKAGETLSVTFSFVVTEKGDVTDFEVVEGTDTASPVGMAVLTAYSRWKYSPALKDGVPVRVRVMRRHTFMGADRAATAAVPSVVWDGDMADVRPRKLSGSAPVFPLEAPPLRPGQRASVTVSFVVDELGDVSDMQLLESAGEALDAAVVTAFKSWKYSPAVKDGLPIKVRISQRFTFLGG